MSIDSLENVQGVETKRRKSLDSIENAIPTPGDFLCLLTNKIMDEPVQIETGETFEKAAIEKWFSGTVVQNTVS